MRKEDLRYYSPCEVAEMLGCSMPSVYRYLRSGKLKAGKRGKRGGWVVTFSDVAEFVSLDSTGDHD